IANSRHIKNEADVIYVGQLFDEIQITPEKVKTEALTNPYYVDRLINQAGDVTVVLVRFIAQIENRYEERGHMSLEQAAESLAALRAVVQEHQRDFSAPIVIGGSPMATVELTDKIRTDIVKFSLIALTLVALFLFLFFKRLSAVALPILSLVLAISIAMSLMVLGSYPIQVTGTILPSFLLAVCVGDAVHFLRAFYSRFDQGMAKLVAIKEAIHVTSNAMFFTTFMTSAGLLSFAHSEIKPIASFGLFSSLGVWLALFLTLVVLPSLMMLFPLKRRESQLAKDPGEKLLAYVRLLNKHRRPIIVVSMVLLVSSFLLSLKLSMSHDALKWLKPDNPTRQAVELVDKELAGTMQVELLLKSHSGELSVENLMALDHWLNKLKNASTDIPIRSVNSLLDLLKQTHHVFVPEAGLSLPESDALLAQEILLLDLNAADQISRLCSADCSELRVTLTTPWRDAVDYTAFLDDIKNSFQEDLGHLMQLQVTGMASIVNRTSTAMLSSMFVSYILAASLVSLLMMIFVRQLGLGFALMLPNLIPIFFVLAMMKLLGMPLDLFSLLMGSIAIGLIVDDSVHLVSSFKRNFGQSLNAEYAMAKTLQHTGAALFVTTCVLCAGFMTYVFSDLQNIADFGFLTASCIGLALVADLIVAPSVILVFYGKQGLAKPTRQTV
ncbi:MAG: MMPL family transporter, partial [Cellvibrionales bacterium]|nr:MMPL family transporter [Cellvibrionales bacterium]